jgi:N-acetylmuramoyl-L-alanine amidase
MVLPKYTAVSYKAYNSSWSTVHIGSKVYYTASSWLTKGKAPAAPEAAPKGTVYINTPGDVLNVRSKASLSSSVIGQLAHASQVSHYGTTNGFYKIKYNGKDGYISAAFTQTLKPSANSPIIVLDPGHGGKDPGAINGTFYEKDVVLDIAKRAEKYLREKYGYTVKLTRSTDIFIETYNRAPLAKSMGGVVFVSLHNNADPKRKADGIETYYSANTNQASRSRSLATSIQNNLMSMMSSSGMGSRGVKSAAFTVINHSLMPSALVELGFITSAKDVALLRNGGSRQKMAEGVAEGIVEYLKANK